MSLNAKLWSVSAECIGLFSIVIFATWSFSRIMCLPSSSHLITHLAFRFGKASSLHAEGVLGIDSSWTQYDTWRRWPRCNTVLTRSSVCSFQHWVHKQCADGVIKWKKVLELHAVTRLKKRMLMLTDTCFQAIWADKLCYIILYYL